MTRLEVPAMPVVSDGGEAFVFESIDAGARGSMISSGQLCRSPSPPRRLRRHKCRIAGE